MTKAALVRYRIVRARPNAGDEELSSIEYNRMETICYLGTLAAATASHHFFANHRRYSFGRIPVR
jgi:hypothetical protein